jgi:hypothetical protein
VLQPKFGAAELKSDAMEEITGLLLKDSLEILPLLPLKDSLEVFSEEGPMAYEGKPDVIEAHGSEGETDNIEAQDSLALLSEASEAYVNEESRRAEGLIETLYMMNGRTVILNGTNDTNVTNEATEWVDLPRILLHAVNKWIDATSIAFTQDNGRIIWPIVAGIICIFFSLLVINCCIHVKLENFSSKVPGAPQRFEGGYDELHEVWIRPEYRQSNYSRQIQKR